MVSRKVYLVVFYDPEGSVIWPYGRDPDCIGALQIDEHNPLVFVDRAQAQQAIRISKANAKLLQAQGRIPNDDFLSGAKSVRVVGCEIVERVEGDDGPG